MVIGLSSSRRGQDEYWYLTANRPRPFFVMQEFQSGKRWDLPNKGTVEVGDMSAVLLIVCSGPEELATVKIHNLSHGGQPRVYNLTRTDPNHGCTLLWWTFPAAGNIASDPQIRRAIEGDYRVEYYVEGRYIGSSELSVRIRPGATGGEPAGYPAASGERTTPAGDPQGPAGVSGRETNWTVLLAIAVAGLLVYKASGR